MEGGWKYDLTALMDNGIEHTARVVIRPRVYLRDYALYIARTRISDGLLRLIGKTEISRLRHEARGSLAKLVAQPPQTISERTGD